MHFLKEMPVHEMQKLRKERRVNKCERRKERRVNERENTERRRKRERKMERWKKISRVWKLSLNIPSYTVEWRGTERRGVLEPWRRCQ